MHYSAPGPQGLLADNTVYIALTRGGMCRATESDTQVPYLKAVLGFLGCKNLHFIDAEGLHLGPEAAEKGFAQAEVDLAAALA